MTSILPTLRKKLLFTDDDFQVQIGDSSSNAEAANWKLEAIHQAMLSVIEAVEEHIECEPGMYANECVGLGGAEGLQSALAALKKACGVE